VTSYIRWFRDISADDVPAVGGKNASLGELYRELTTAGVRVPQGFAVTADAYSAVIATGDLGARIARRLRGIDGRDVAALAAAGASIRPLTPDVPRSERTICCTPMDRRTARWSNPRSMR
jgi:pyruvate,water dikinase